MGLADPKRRKTTSKVRLTTLDISDDFPIRSVWLMDLGPNYLGIRGRKRIVRLDTTREAFNRVVPKGVLIAHLESEMENILGTNLKAEKRKISKRLAKLEKLRAKGWAV